MDRETPVSDEGTREETEPEIFGDEDEGVGRGTSDEREELSDAPALDEGDLEEADEAGDEAAAESGGEDAEGRPRRRRRRRRRRPGDRGPGDRGPREERRPSRPAASDEAPQSRSLADEPPDDDLDEDSGDLTGESELGADDEIEEGEDAPRVYRNVPTWEEAISFLVHKRPSEGRSRDDSGGDGPREPRRDGGRPR
jgi:hypothetical protein